MNFDQWWNEDYDDKDNPFEKDSFGYWAYAGWCAALAQPEQEPVAWMYVNEDGECEQIEYGVSTIEAPYIKLLYTAPPSKPWVSLTDEEVKSILDCGRGGLVDIKKTEQLFKERNNG